MNFKHFLQTHHWAQVREAQGHKAIWIDGNLILIKNTKLGSFGVMNQPFVRNMDFDKLHSIAKENNLIYIHIDPNDLKGELNLSTEVKNKYSLKSAKDIIMRQTSVIDLTKSEEELLAQMDKNTRYNSKYGLKKGVTVAMRDDEEAVEIFLKLYQETVERANFFGRTPDYYRTVWNILRTQNAAKISIAEYEGEPLVARFLFATDEGLFTPYTGYSRKFSNLKPTHASFFEVLRWGQSNGYKFINLWGVKPDAPESDPEYGYTKFKLGYGGEVIDYEDSFSMILDPMKFRMFTIGNNLRWSLLRFKKMFV
jgi:lipid II:glycine glycyltransferase (peptidoglycan interpeptide bridge formation enzyme)